MHLAIGLWSAVGAALVGCTAVPASADDAAARLAEQVLRKSLSGATSEQWNTRVKQDATQAACSKFRNQPPPQIAAEIASRARSAVRYPQNAVLIGDWRAGEQLASIGTGGQISSLNPEAPSTPRGGNCYACHMLAPTEVAAGTLGPSLTGYGKRYGTAPDAAKTLYQKIYNAQAFVPCSVMPRFGHNGWLTPEQIADIVAYLLDPASPVNK